MLKNYLITALRNLKRNKVYTLLNIFGLALGIGCALVIFKVITFERSFDTHQAHYDHIYRIVTKNIHADRVDKGMGVPHPLGPALREEYPELQAVTRTVYFGDGQLNTYGPNGELHKFMIDEGISFVDANFFEVFTVEWIAGDPASALSEPKSVVIAQREAQKLFGIPEGHEYAVLGKLINFNNVRDFKVTGVIKNPPQNTSLPFSYLFDYAGQEGEVNPYYDGGTSWNMTSSSTNAWVLVHPGFDQQAFNDKLLPFVDKYHEEGRSRERNYLAQPLSEVHFDKEYGAYKKAISSEFLFALAVIGIFLIITACINFINLATAQAANRAKEIGIRKAIGGMSHQLVVQFLSEIALITFCSLLLALAISELLFKFLYEIIGHELSLNLTESPETILFLGVLFVVVSLLSGFYPSMLLARMNAVAALKKKITGYTHSGGLPLRKALVIAQFVISQFLIIGTLVISSQTDYFLTKDLGFETDAILTSYLPERDEQKMERFRRELLQSPAISKASFGLSQPTGTSDSHSNFNYAPLEIEQDYHGNFKAVDEHYLDLFAIEVIAGRGVQKGDSNHVVVNKKVADLMGFKDRYAEAVGETLSTGWGGDKKIVGVIENFHTYSLERDMDYVIMLYVPHIFYNVSFQAASVSTIADARAHFEQTWDTIYPEYVLDYDFYNQTLAENYEEVQNITALLKFFGLISILIGCLGLYGLVAFMAMNKTKEIGVRKALGASIYHILLMFSREVLVLMSVAFVITAPIAFLTLNQWLDNFTFRIAIGPWFFVIAFLITLLIAIITISHKTISSALINPAQTLKDD